MRAYIHTKSNHNDCFQTIGVECIIKPLWWQEQGLSFTRSGYGKRIATQYMVKWHGKWRRVYCCIYSNIGTGYIGKIEDRLNVQIED